MDITIGMAVFDDFHGCYFSSESLRMHHGIPAERIIVVDTNPTSNHGVETRSFCESAGVRYFTGPTDDQGRQIAGTYQPRNAVFDHADTEYVMCIDSHVLLMPGWQEAIEEFYRDPSRARDLFFGRILFSNLASGATEYQDQWRSEMHGTWHDRPNDGSPFEIWGMGMGLFGCRKDSWLRFNEHFRGLGGGESYIFHKYRLAGRRLWCIPKLQWNHRFPRPDGVPFARHLTQWNKIRNHLIGCRELNLDTEPARRHFVLGEGRRAPQGKQSGRLVGAISQEHWDYLLADPVARSEPPPRQQQSAMAEDTLELAVMRQRDLTKHAQTIRDFAAKCDSVIGFVKRREWLAFLGAGRPKSITLYSTEPSRAYQYQSIACRIDHSLEAEPDECDMLVIDTVHSADRLTKELNRHGPHARRFIMLRGTQAFGELAEGRKGQPKAPGLRPAMRRWMKDNPQWSVVYHSTEQYGLTVLGSRKEDKPQLPGAITVAGNLAEAAVKFTRGKGQRVPAEVRDKRLEVCTLCEHRRDDRCSVCGCYVAAKASLAPQAGGECPLGMWPPATEGKAA